MATMSPSGVTRSGAAAGPDWSSEHPCATLPRRHARFLYAETGSCRVVGFARGMTRDGGAGKEDDGGLVPARSRRDRPGRGGLGPDRLPGHLRRHPRHHPADPGEERANPRRPPKRRGGGFSDIYIGGVHVHHQVWGILLVLVSGLLEFRFNPARRGRRCWPRCSGSGRRSPSTSSPSGSTSTTSTGARRGAIDRRDPDRRGARRRAADGGVPGRRRAAGGRCHLALRAAGLLPPGHAGVCFVKGKLATGLIGIVVPIVATVGAIRLANRHRSGPADGTGRKLARSHRRFDVDYQRRRDRLRDLLGGAPEPDESPRRCHDPARSIGRAPRACDRPAPGLGRRIAARSSPPAGSTRAARC